MSRHYIMTPWIKFLGQHYKACKAKDKSYTYKKAMKDAAKKYKKMSKTRKSRR